MTMTDPTTLRCPSCGNTITAPLDGGRRLCISCRHEWNPNDAHTLRVVPPIPPEVPAEAPVVAVPSHPATPPPAPLDPLEGVLGPPPEVAEAERALEALYALVGTDVVLEGGQLATIADFPDDDHLEVVIGAGTDSERTEVVDLNDVVRSVDAPPPVLEVDDATARALAGVNLTVAALVLQAGLASIAGEYPNAELLTPPAGWLPLDADGLPALEQGVAYAVAFLIHAYSIDRGQVAAMAEMLFNASQENQPTKGGTE
jgi:hypothetical protein